MSAPSTASKPQLTLGGSMPRPRNERKASNSITAGIVSVRYTITTESTFGTRCTNRILRVEAPRTRAASTNCVSFISTSACSGVLVRARRTVHDSRDGASNVCMDGGGAVRFQKV